jgi:hypothetical protein
MTRITGEEIHRFATITTRKLSAQPFEEEAEEAEVKM